MNKGSQHIFAMDKILSLTDQYNSKWDEYIKQSPEGTFYHLTGWKKMIEKTFGLQALYLMALSETNELMGVLPLFYMKDLLRRKYLVSIPYSAYAGVCADDETIKNALFNKAKKLAFEREVQYIEIRKLGERAFELPTKEDFVTMFLELERDEEYIWKHQLNAKARNKVRKAYSEGLTIDFGKKYLDDFYKILSINIRDLGSPNYPKLFLENLFKEFGDSAGIFVVKYQKKIIAGMLFVCFKNVFLDPWAASLREYNKLRPNDILYWEAIKYASEKGYEYFDMGRSTVESGTFKFKEKWGAKPVRLCYQYFLHKTLTIPVVNAHNNKYQKAINVWKKMPVIVADILGPRLIKYLPEL